MTRIACLSLCLFVFFPGVVWGEKPDDSLRSDYKYAWPRQQQIVLDGDWQMAYSDPPAEVKLPENLDQFDWIPVELPTEVHWALYRAGKCPHPYEGLTPTTLRWVENKSWWFRKRFTVPEKLRSQYSRLMVEGVDYYGYYWLNGHYLGRSEGAFGAAKMGLGNLRFGAENELVIRVDCGGYKLGQEGGDPRPSLVKADLWAGWQVGAYDMNTVGIWQPCRIVMNDWPCLERPFVHTVEIGDKQATVRTMVELCTLNEDEAACKLTVTVRGRDSETEPVTKSIDVKPVGPMVIPEMDLTVPEPKLWWPNGMGEQPMYEAEFVLSRAGKTLDRLTVPFGIRTIERRRGDMPRTSYAMREWIFYVNGKPMFVKGTNWMPIDALADTRPERYEWCLSAARDAGIQMIRIWGGGILEPDVFYDLCDRYGIMVWQDFPVNVAWQVKGMNRTVWENTVQWAVFRLRNHPSLAFWCGGNEFPPDAPANGHLVGTMARATRILDGTRPFMAASPDEGDVHAYPQWDAPKAWNSPLKHGPFVSEWGSHGMPTSGTWKQMVRAEEADARIGPTLLKMDKKLMEEQYPEVTYHWVEFIPSRLPQMLARGSSFDNLAEVPLGRFSEAVGVGAGEFYKYSAEAARGGYPNNGGLLFWVWKRPWPVVAIQILDGMGQPQPVFYDIKHAYSSPWPCLIPPELFYAPGEGITCKTAVFSEVNKPEWKDARLTVRLIGPDLKTHRQWLDLPPVDVAAGPEPVWGPEIAFEVPEDFARAFFFAVVELHSAQGERLARNAYAFRCPPQMEDATFRAEHRAQSKHGFMTADGPWLRPQLEKYPCRLASELVSFRQVNPARAEVVVKVKNVGERPAVMVRPEVAELVQYVADDAYFWLEPGEERTLALRVRLTPDSRPEGLTVAVTAWNAPEAEPICVKLQ